MYYSFADRHIGPDDKQVKHMLATIGVKSVNDLIAKIIPELIRLQKPLNLPEAMSEFEYLNELKATASENQVFKNFIGMGYYNTIVPGVIKRNIFENPGWYTAYTPYQAEIAQGRMEALLNFQTMVCDLTGMQIANASLLDEGTAAAEAMVMFYYTRSKEAEKKNACKFFVSENCFPQTIDVLRTRSKPLDIELVVGDEQLFSPDDSFFGALLQYPDAIGNVLDYKNIVNMCHRHEVRVCVAADILSLVLLTPPGEWGADCVVGSTQRFGVPMGYGGPHAAYFATHDVYKRNLPGRIIGMSVDAEGNPALRMALQTREQHIRRDKATSNICTAQVLLAVMASMYAVYHGAEGLKAIATTVHKRTTALAESLKKAGFKVVNNSWFDTLTVEVEDTESVRDMAEANLINFRYNGNTVGVSIDETTSDEDLKDILRVFAASIGKKSIAAATMNGNAIPAALLRSSEYMTNAVFNTHHSETEMLRYIKRLENKDLALNHSMISLGSCTMKLNATSEMEPLSWPEFANMHPFAPIEQAQGYAHIISELENFLKEITGFAAVSLQPNSGAQGEYAGLVVIQKYHSDRGQSHRNVVLIPQSAHGTNPASAVLAGLKVVVVKCDDDGNIDLSDLRLKAEQHQENLSCLMVTYPSTHGVYEENIKQITAAIHANGGQVYMDGANMNAQVGLTCPALIGADVCHLNLHKTFAIPHGGGGPGMGPIGVAEHLAPFLPSHTVVPTGGRKGVNAVSAAPWGSALILLISYGYIKMLGKTGVQRATEIAMLNANYIKARLEKHYPVLYKGKNGFCAHEMILDCRAFKAVANVDVTDIAKRLMDYGFHAPTVAFPVAGTLMVEPTESEPLEEIDRFCDAMIAIRHEIMEVINGEYSKEDNMLVNAPHTALEATADEWKHSYSRQKAVFPAPWVAGNKFWPSVKRVDNAYGDRNLICTCPDVSAYETAEAV
ncbi:MAG TPA: aminomethyl-transferring glycine dehydrogenase [Bacteroidia bacterium]|nr:aminomethyl-transferring glycine dehydrogenase [Bacteroidia bacterium]MBP7713589.1 aminomethyl-transferring glycine dehydrogenase [Bacteroidia bacterium]MBP8667666.1 aminomethyl-transferring glycine dehydrogenase [Bacteroidia bacterium]HOZ81302.1 aminomethyl-transferring glycine dehydrogenase [Bacteroidia bacterium]HOZ90570.1 aminomethyl-transferring glycine dehydrogenase [Bacteroidia bacterium]